MNQFSNATVRVAVIGSGRWGKNIIKTLTELPEAEIVAVGDRSTDLAVLAKQDINAVIIATPGSTHAEVARPFIERGMPTFIEKPLTTSLQDARALKAAAEKSGALVFVGHVHLYNPAFLAAREALKDSGLIKMIRWESMNNGPFRSDMSALWDWGPHDVALSIEWLGERPEKVQAWGVEILHEKDGMRVKKELFDSVTMKLLFPSGAVALGEMSWLSPEKKKKMTAISEKDAAVFDDTAERKVTVYRGVKPAKDAAGKLLPSVPSLECPDYEKTAPLKRELEAFINAVRDGSKPQTDLEQGLAVVSVLDAAERSIESGGGIVDIEYI